MSRVLMPLPDRDFDPTEAAVPWKLLTEAGHEVVVATETGAAGVADPYVVRAPIPGFGAAADAVRCYEEMQASPALSSPLAWDDVDASSFDALFLCGGHAAGMRAYLESERVQAMTRAVWEADRPVAAICHGVIVLARTPGSDGRSLLTGRRTTCLPKYMEQVAFYLTAWRLGRRYRTYPAYVEDEVRDALGADGRFERGPIHLVARGTRTDDGPTFVVEDGRYLSARWPGDAYAIAARFAERLAKVDR